MAKKHFKIYQSRWHLLATLAFIAVPFLFLLSFSVVAKLSFQSIILDTVVSFWRVVVAYIISVVLAWACAMLFFQGKKSSVALPIFDVLQSIPTFAALPLAVAYWGPSNGTVILFLVFAIIWPIFFSVVSALKMVKRDWEEAVEMADLKGFHYIRYFLLPISIPSLITGSIIGLGDGWEALVAMEMIVRVRHGLGTFFVSSSHNSTVTIFGILGFLLLIFCINKLVWLPLMEWSHRTLEE